MSGTIRYGYVTIAGQKLFVKPEDYTLTSFGTKTQLVPTANGYFLDVGKGFYGFTIRTLIYNASIITTIENAASNALKNKSPMSVTDTVYPGGKSWSGYVDLPVVKTGSLLTSSMFGMPANLATEAIEISFIDTTLRSLWW